MKACAAEMERERAQMPEGTLGLCEALVVSPGVLEGVSFLSNETIAFLALLPLWLASIARASVEEFPLSLVLPPPG